MAGAAAGALLGFAAAAAASPPAAGQVTSTSFTVLARADAVRVQLADPVIPIAPEGRVLDASPATAQALFTSTGESRAFASSPHPGDFVISMNPTLVGVSGGDYPVLPDYPFIVSSEHPVTPTAEQRNGPFGIGARSDGDRSAADAAVGLVREAGTLLGSVSATAEAVRDPATGTLTARAETSTDLLTLGSLLSITGVRSVAEVVAAVGAEPVTTSHLEVGSILVLGVPVDLAALGLAPSEGNPLGTLLGDALAPLAGQGIDIEVLPAVEAPGSIVSEGLAITIHQEPPGQSPIDVEVVLGQATARADAIIEVPAPVDPVVRPGPAATSSGGGGTAAGSTSGPVATPAPSAVVVAAPASSTSELTAATVWAPRLLGDLATPFYLALVGLAAAILAAWVRFSSWIRLPAGAGGDDPPLLRWPDR